MLPNRTYAVAIETDATSGSGFSLRGTHSNDEDDGGAEGWSIHNQTVFHNGNGWVLLSDTAFKLAVTGTPDTSDTLSPLTVQFGGVPDSHDGSKFKVRAEFSERIVTDYKDLRNEGFSAMGGKVTGAKRVNGWNDLWSIEVDPDGLEPVTLTLEADRDCDEKGAACPPALRRPSRSSRPFRCPTPRQTRARE